ncbi:Receptor transporting protein [Fasciola gigantica]|uniref:Receptor transporting protein n=1 Tax=Fasciola gigantica TaxID=46835 RepID=A0A504YT09_FASGI|nr:Receptor transporting protein [Fasciola gigantica]
MITVDYYETMKSTHWDPKFKELSCRLTKELVRVNYSRTGMAADLWPLATLSRLRPLTSESLFPSSATALLDALGLKEKDMLGTLITSDIPSWDVQCRTACGRQWTSMKGSVAFVVILNYHRTGPVQVDRWLIQPGANVFFELFSQSCGECDVLCQPKWYPEEVSKVIRNLFVKIHENFYQSVIGWSDRWDCHRRDGHPSGPHDARKCVACQQGLCRGGLVISHAHAAKPASMFRVFPVYCPAQSTTVNVTNPATSPGMMVDSAQNSGRPHIRDSPTNSPSCKRRQTGSEFLTVS